MLLIYFDPRKTSLVQIDTVSFGATLMQKGKPKVLASKSLTEIKQRDANIERFSDARNSEHTYMASHLSLNDHKPLKMRSLKISQKS